MSDGDQRFPHRSDAAVTISSQLMIAAVIFLFMVVVFIFFLYLYAKHYMGSHRALRGGRSGRFIFAAADVVPVRRRGLDEEILNSLPVTSFKAADFKDGGLECSVCLSEVADGEKILLLPKCSHGFHVGCIGMWFHSHSTCPLCRAAVEAPAPANDAGPGAEAPAFPTNVLFWGSQGGVSGGGGAAREENSGASGGPGRRPEGMLVIDIPRRPAEGFLPSPMSPLPTSRFAATEEMKTPKSSAAAAEENARTPMSARLKSLRRLLSRGKRVVGSSSSSSSSPRGGDIEQGGGVAVGGGAVGEGSSLAPKTPTS